jgi:hypothetical protein
MQTENSGGQTADAVQDGAIAANDCPPQAVGDLPQRVEGRISDVWINRGPTVASARLGPGPGRYAADLWRIEGNPFPWRVRADGHGVQRFGAEADAVAFFIERVHAAANGSLRP